MTSASDTPPRSNGAEGGAKRKRKTDTAFEQWLQRGLHQMFDDVANEPVPDELRKLIDDDRGA